MIQWKQLTQVPLSQIEFYLIQASGVLGLYRSFYGMRNLTLKCPNPGWRCVKRVWGGSIMARQPTP